MSEKNQKASATYDSTFIDRLRQGDENAFRVLDDTLFKKYRAYLINAKKFREADAHDAVQDLATRLIQNLSRFDFAKGNFEAWINTIFANLVRDIYRRKARQLESAQENIDDVIIQQETTTCLLPEPLDTAIQQLNKKDRGWIELFLSGHPKQVIMKQLGISTNGAYDAFKSRVLSKLRKKVIHPSTQDEGASDIMPKSMPEFIVD